MSCEHKFASFKDNETGNFILVHEKIKYFYDFEIRTPKGLTSKGRFHATNDEEVNTQLEYFYGIFSKGQLNSKKKPYLEVTVVLRKYNPEYGDNRVCECGHIYERHFDSYDDMRDVGCKYCGCCDFKERQIDKEIL